MKLESIFDNCEADNIGPPDGYTEIKAIIDKAYSEITVGDYKEIEDFLSTHLNELPPAKRARHHSVQLTWYIPTAAVPLLLLKAYQAREFFTLQPTIVYFSIVGVMVWDKDEAYSPQVVCCLCITCKLITLVSCIATIVFIVWVVDFDCEFYL